MNYGKAKNSLIFIIMELISYPKGKITIENHPTDDGFIITLLDRKRKVRTYHMQYSTIDGEQELPIPSKVEWDEYTQQIQQRMPVKYLLQSQKPRYRSYVAGNRPPMRRTKRYPLSNPKYKNPRIRRSRRVTTISQKELSKLNFLELAVISEVTEFKIKP